MMSKCKHCSILYFLNIKPQIVVPSRFDIFQLKLENVIMTLTNLSRALIMLNKVTVFEIKGVKEPHFIDRVVTRTS